MHIEFEFGMKHRLSQRVVSYSQSWWRHCPSVYTISFSIFQFNKINFADSKKSMRADIRFEMLKSHWNIKAWHEGQSICFGLWTTLSEKHWMLKRRNRNRKSEIGEKMIGLFFRKKKLNYHLSARRYLMHRSTLFLKQSYGVVNSILLIMLIRPFRETFWQLLNLVLQRRCHRKWALPNLHLKRLHFPPNVAAF